MNEKRKRFCEYYVGECAGNVVQSALKSGYSESYANHLAYKLLDRQDVQEYIRELSKDGEKKRIATSEDIQRFWTDVLNDTKEQTKNRLRASELLAKVQGLFNNDW